jgi:hypothetical protein
LLQDRLHLDEQLDDVADHHAAAVHEDIGGDVEVFASISPVTENPARMPP